MKTKYTIIFIILFSFIGGLTSIEAQFRDLPVYDAPTLDPFGNPQADGFNSNSQPILDPFGGVIVDPPSTNDEFNFVLGFAAFNIVQQLRNQFIQANRAAVDRWIAQQESVLEREIERQLNRNLSNFDSAQREFFRKWSLESRNRAISAVQSPLATSADRLALEQVEFSEEIFNLRQWGDLNLIEDCKILTGGDCDRFRNRRVQGVLLKNITNRSYLNRLLDQSINDFSIKEYDRGEVVAKIKGLNDALLNGFLEPNQLAERHINFVNNRNTQDRILFMVAYLIANNLRVYAQGAPIFSGFNLPSLFSNFQIEQEANRRATLSSDIMLFAPNVILEDNTLCRQRTITVPGPSGSGSRVVVCDALSLTEVARRNQIIDDHLERVEFEDAVQRGTITDAQALEIANDVARNLDRQMTEAHNKAFNIPGLATERGFLIERSFPPPLTKPVYSAGTEIIGEENFIPAESFFPPSTLGPIRMLRFPDGKLANGFFHTHPYSLAQGGFRKTAFSAADVSWMRYIENKAGNFSIVESGDKRFALVIIDADKFQTFLDINNQTDIQEAFNFIYESFLNSSGSNFEEAVREAIRVITIDTGLIFLETNDTQKLNFIKVR